MSAWVINARADINYAKSSQLSSGRWIKVKVDSTGIHRIDYDTLRQWGFPDPAKVGVFGYGSLEQAHEHGSSPDDLPQVAILHTGQALYFYGESERRITPLSPTDILCIKNHYSRGSYYFLNDNNSPKEIDHRSSQPSAHPSDTHTFFDFRQPEEYNPAAGGVFFYSRNFSQQPDGLIMKFRSCDYQGEGHIAYRYIFRHSESSPQAMDIKLSGNIEPGPFTTGAVRANDEDNLLYSRVVIKKIPVKFVSDSEFSITFSSKKGNRFSLLAISEAYFIYSRLNRFHQQKSTIMDFPPSNENITARIHDCPKNLMVWDVTTPVNPIDIDVFYEHETTRIVTLPYASPSLPRRICAFTTDSKLPAPTFAGTVRNQNLHSSPSVDYLIVTTEKFRHEAERLASAHRDIQGLNVAVACQEDIFNEFSSGSPHPNAIRKFVDLLRSRADRPLRYLLLFGASTNTPRKITAEPPKHLIGYQTEYIDHARYDTRCHASDLYFGMPGSKIPANIAENYVEIPISIGRAPVLTGEEARIFVNKCIAYLNDPRLAGRFGLALLACCEGDSDTHLESSENLFKIINSQTPEKACSRIYPQLYPSTGSNISSAFRPLTVQLPRGPMLFNYTGHSSPSALSDILTINNTANLVYGSMPIVFLSSCDTSPIDHESRGIGTAMFFNPAGPIAVIGAGRAVYLANNRALNEEFVRQLYGNESLNHIGDIWRNAVNTTSRLAANQRTNNLCYNLIGDPALPLRRPDKEISLISINGHTSKDSCYAEVCDQLELKGKVTDFDGKLDTTFNGNLTLTLYDSPVTIHDIDIEDSILHEICTRVTEGSWETEMTTPRSSRPDTTMMTFHAYSDDGRMAYGSYGKVILSSQKHSEPNTDTIPPHITFSIEPQEEKVYSPSVSINISILDTGSGIANSGSVIGSAIRVTLDGASIPFAPSLLRHEPDGNARLPLHLTNLSDGHHHIKIYARDIAGNTSSESIHFTVINTPLKAILSTDCTVARDHIEFSLQPTLSSETESTLLIQDFKGNTVFRQERISFPYLWNLRSTDGTVIPNGRYQAYVIFKSPPRYGSTTKIPFIVVHPYNPTLN